MATALSSAQQCGLPISAVAPNPSCAHATAATPVVEEPSRDQVEERGDAERRERRGRSGRARIWQECFQQERAGWWRMVMDGWTDGRLMDG